MNNLQGANGWEQNHTYGLLRGGCEGMLQHAAWMGLDTC
jgi:hypothetical protein